MSPGASLKASLRTGSSILTAEWLAALFISPGGQISRSRDIERKTLSLCPFEDVPSRDALS